MLRAFVIATSLVAGATAAQEVPVPSGVQMTLFEVVLEQTPDVARFRFVVPDIAGGAVPFFDLVDDIAYLCEAVAIPSLAANNWTTGDVVISLSAEDVPFGEVSPDVTQYFQPFSIQNDTCIWEEF